jgi:hypothetical protein
MSTFENMAAVEARCAELENLSDDELTPEQSDDLDAVESFIRLVTRNGIDDDAADAALDCTGGNIEQAGGLLAYGGPQVYASAREYGESFLDAYDTSAMGVFVGYIDWQAFGEDALSERTSHEYNGAIYIFEV